MIFDLAMPWIIDEYSLISIDNVKTSSPKTFVDDNVSRGQRFRDSSEMTIKKAQNR
jgi:hypothetical protein